MINPYFLLPPVSETSTLHRKHRLYVNTLYYTDLAEGVGAGGVRGGDEGLEADLAHQVLVHLRRGHSQEHIHITSSALWQ